MIFKIFRKTFGEKMAVEVRAVFERFFVATGTVARDRCYDFLNISQNIWLKIGIF
jgi:hypothetical protein